RASPLVGFDGPQHAQDFHSGPYAGPLVIGAFPLVEVLGELVEDVGLYPLAVGWQEEPSGDGRSHAFGLGSLVVPERGVPVATATRGLRDGQAVLSVAFVDGRESAVVTSHVWSLGSVRSSSGSHCP